MYTMYTSTMYLSRPRDTTRDQEPFRFVYIQPTNQRFTVTVTGSSRSSLVPQDWTEVRAVMQPRSADSCMFNLHSTFLSQRGPRSRPDHSAPQAIGCLHMSL